MNSEGSGLDAESILQRFDRSSSDALLQSIARELLRLDEANALLQARLSAMESLLALSDRIAASQEPEFAAPYPDKIAIDAADSFLGALGFYELEHDMDGLPFRWSGPDRQFSFQLFVNRQEPCYFDLTFGQFFAEAPIDRLQCRVDGENVELSLEGARGRYQASGVLPPRKDRGGTLLTFVCPEMASPESLGYADRRLLGLTFYRLTADKQAPSPATAEPRFSAGATARAVDSGDSAKSDTTTPPSISPLPPVESGPAPSLSAIQIAATGQVLAGAVAQGAGMGEEALEREADKPISQNIVFSAGRLQVRKEGG
ncbi:hypothetical protein [uncultured Rhodoblastus sp.]|uniref:hypothetical protein n=1 Tax=uncultured Rhodoblastus sp. TaxID=543037 RepID=UPI0025D922C2|nr:hypothetical protein [uncultured Rhodoblastus sp.]